MYMFSEHPKNLRYLKRRTDTGDLMSGKSNYLKRGINYYKRNGFTKSFFKAAERLMADKAQKDYRHNPAGEEEIAAQKEHVFENPYRFSILVPVYETNPQLFRKMLDSVGDQTYGNWELILADASADELRRGIVREFTEEYGLKCKDIYGSVFDKVTYIKLTENKGISANTNEALARAKGDYVGLLDHDDVLENTALFDIMSAIEKEENIGRSSESIKKIMAVYTDEDKVSEDGSVYFDPNFKPGFDPVLLCTNNYICHFFVADTELVKGTGGFRPEYDGAQDHDIILRCLEGVRRDRIIHVPNVLYHWRSTDNSTAENPESKLYAYEAGKRAVADYFKRAGVGVKVTDLPHLGFFELGYDFCPKTVETITKEQFEQRCKDKEGLPDTEFVMILSSGLEPVNDDYLADMMSVMNRPHTGAVTGKIIDRSNKIESAGFDIDDTGTPLARNAGLSKHFSGYMHRASLDRLSDAFSPDCVLLRTEAVKETDPEIKLKEGFDIYYRANAVFKRR